MNTQHENSLYRRGIVLGLTMAEVIILITFCLLLLLSNIVGKKNDEIQKVKAEVQQKDEQLAMLGENKNLASDLQKLYKELDTDSFDDTFKELILMREKSKSLVVELKKLQEKTKELQKYEEAFGESDLSVNDVVNIVESVQELILTRGQSKSLVVELKKLHEKTKKLQEYEEAFGKSDLSVNDVVNIVESVQRIMSLYPELLPSQEAISGLPDKIARLETQTTTSQNRMVYLQKKLERVGKGTEKPACWATASGKSEYIFEMAMTSNGIIIHNNELPHRAVEQAELPCDSIDFDRELDNQSFSVATQALYDWSNKNECRFFVKVFDHTKQSEKSKYKKRLRVVGEHFYYFEPTDDKPRWVSY